MGISPVPFHIFGPSHKLVLGLIVLVPVLLSVLVRTLRNERVERVLCWILALIIGFCWVSWYVVFGANGWLHWGNALPLDLCSWAAIAVIIALIRKSQTAYELAWFWAIAGTVQGIVTPDIPFDFPDFRFLEFSLFHGAIIAAALFLTLGLKMRPHPDALLRVIKWSLVYMAVAGLADWALKVNYGFLRAKPGHASPYDLMPDWPWYNGVVVVLAIASVFLCYLPFFLVDLATHLRRRITAP